MCEISELRMLRGAHTLDHIDMKILPDTDTLHVDHFCGLLCG